MADAPKTESGSGWGAFEIGIVVLIIVALLSRGDNRASETIQPENTNPVVEDNRYSLGIQITSPTTNTIVGSTFTLRGIVEGGYWNPNSSDGVIASYQVIDAEGVPLSDFKTIKKDSAVYTPSYVFEDTVVLTRIPKTKTGTIVLLSSTPDAENQTVSVRIPIRFQK